jgi:DNA-binding NtrC family response regulator
MDSPQSRPATVLVVDDDIVLREIFSLMARDCDWTTLDAATIDEALAVIEAERPALVLSDYWMPGGNGVQLLEAVRERWPDQRFVLWSSSLPPHAAVRAGELGADVMEKRAGPELRRLLASTRDAAPVAP